MAEEIPARTARFPSPTGGSAVSPIGITFAVYGDKDAAERLIPFDIVPRVLGRDEWGRLEAGLIQRVKALNMFLTDVYGDQEILRAGHVRGPDFRNECYRPEMQGHPVPHNIWTHIAGIDIVRSTIRFLRAGGQLRTPPACPTCWKIAK